ncbi:FG-GAP and VCBS repeat-containing protein [Pseudosporangium ferrugineum]|uniref:FG-GAP repeat protein n=1 Tax=Pseudosporangium ferrugineum TaxID=439699 RepID=A0A2T0SFB1_9ACTN|nr:FG-GAP and VCBS repeat-containing protein [Pseudosporangium ferrugineum]PRY32105.1 FG-GAP repeat protein [Pseudosporangium ferrugineum]
MNRKYAAAAAMSGIVLAVPGPAVAHAAAPEARTITRDGASITFQRVAAPATQRSGSGPVTSDFDGDGLDDIAAAARGGVVVRYSSGGHVDYLGGTGGGDALTLGAAITSGDFDNDGYDDLVVGNPAEADGTNRTVAGGLWIFPGSADGLRASAVRHLNQSSAGVPGDAEAGDEFGGALAAGDINGDGRADLAVGLPGETIGTVPDAGGLVMFLSDARGISTTGARWLDQGTAYVPGSPTPWDRFGDRLAIGHFNHDGYGDLAIASTGENEGGTGASRGMVNLILGAGTGLNVIGVFSVEGDDFGTAAPGVRPVRLGYGGLTMADTDKDGADELFAGTPEAVVAGADRAGMVAVLKGGNDGFFVTPSSVLTRATAGVPDDPRAGDGFGAAVAAGDVTGDGLGDLVVGVPGQDVVDAPGAPRGTVADAGVTSLFRGTATGLVPHGGDISQGYEYVDGVAEPGDRFGHDVRVLNLDGRDGLDAIVSSPGEHGTDLGAPAPPPGDTPGAIYECLGGDPNFMYGIGCTTGTEVATPGFAATVYGYVL